MQSEILEVTVRVLALESSLCQAYPGSNPSVGAVLILKKNWKLQAGSKSQNIGISTVREKLGKKERNCSDSLTDRRKSLGKWLKFTTLLHLS